MTERVLVVGLDGATWSFLDDAIEAGYMPNLAAIRNGGVSGNLESTLPPITPVAWPTFLTGTNPGKHGISGFAQPYEQEDGGYSFHMNDSEDIRVPTMWELLSDRGRTIVSLNLPMTYPPFEVNGALVSGLFTPNSRQEFTYPPELQEELAERGFSPFLKHVAGDISDCETNEQYREKVEELWELVDSKFDQAYYLDERYDWDVFFMQIQETDPLQHFLLGFFDPDHDWYDESMAEFIFEQFYGRIDQRLGELIDDIGAEALTLVVSDHGFQTCEKAVYLGNWLHEEGFAEPSRRGAVVRKTIDWVKRFDILGLRRFLKTSREIAKRKESFTFDWQRSSAISIGAGTNQICPIYVLEPEPKRAQVINQIEAALKDFEDPTTGEPVVKRTFRGADVYDGEYVNQLPSLLVEASDGYTFKTTFHPEESTIVDLVDTTNRPGIHDSSGILAATGQGVRTERTEVNGSLQDILPTVFYSLGEPIPSYVDGEVLSELFDPAMIADREPTYVELSEHRTADQSSHRSEAEEEDVKELLEDLGYID